MNTVFARAVVALGFAALGLVALPASAHASTKANTKHSHGLSRKDAAPKKGKHHSHSHKSATTNGIAARHSKSAPVAAKTVPATPLSEPAAVKAP